MEKISFTGDVAANGRINFFLLHRFNGGNIFVVERGYATLIQILLLASKIVRFWNLGNNPVVINWRCLLDWSSRRRHVFLFGTIRDDRRFACTLQRRG